MYNNVEILAYTLLKSYKKKLYNAIDLWEKRHYFSIWSGLAAIAEILI